MDLKIQGTPLRALGEKPRPGKSIAKQSVGRVGGKNRQGWVGENASQISATANKKNVRKNA
jgi:hypothetical protein